MIEQNASNPREFLYLFDSGQDLHQPPDVGQRLESLNMTHNPV